MHLLVFDSCPIGSKIESRTVLHVVAWYARFFAGFAHSMNARLLDVGVARAMAAFASYVPHLRRLLSGFEAINAGEADHMAFHAIGIPVVANFLQSFEGDEVLGVPPRFVCL